MLNDEAKNRLKDLMLQSVKPKTEAKSSDDIFDLKQLNGIEDKMTRGLAKKIYIISKRDGKKSSENLTDIENELQGADKITDDVKTIIKTIRESI